MEIEKTKKENNFFSFKTTKEYGKNSLVLIIIGGFLRLSGHPLFLQILGLIFGVIGLIFGIVWIIRKIQKKI